MTGRRISCLIVAVLLVLAAVPLARAADDVFGAIPKDSLGFVVVNRLAATDGKLQAIGQAVQMPAPSLLGMLKASTGAKKGLDEKGSAAIVAREGADSGPLPAVLLYVPVTDFGELVGQLKAENPNDAIVKVEVMRAPFLAAKRGKFAVFAEPKHESELKKALKTPAGIADELAPMRKWLGRNDLSAVATRRGVKLLSTKGQEGLKQVKATLEQMPEEMRKDMQAAIQVFGIYEQILQALGNEVESYAIGVDVDEQLTLSVTDWTQFTPGGTAAKAFAEVAASKGNLLEGLPRKPFVFAGAGALPEKLTRAMVDLSIDLMKAAPNLYGVEGDQADKIAQISQQSIKGMQGMSMMLAVGKPGDPIYSNVVGLVKVGDSSKFLADYRKYIQALNELVEKGGKSMMLTKSQIKEMEIGGVPALRLEMEYPRTPATEKIPAYGQMMEKMFGPGGKMVVFMAAADDNSVAFSYTNKAMLRQSLKLLKDSKPGLAADEQVAKTAALLPSGAQWIGYVSPQGTVDFINRVIPTFAPPNGGDLKLPAFPATPPIGLAGKTVPNGLRTYTVVPAPVIKAVGRYVIEVQKKMRPATVETEAVEIVD